MRGKASQLPLIVSHNRLSNRVTGGNYAKYYFMGTPAFSVPILEGLLQAGYKILAVITQPDRKVGRKQVLQQTPVKEAAVKHNLLVLQPEKLSGSPELDQAIALAPDLIVTAAYGQFLPTRFWKRPNCGHQCPRFLAA